MCITHRGKEIRVKRMGRETTHWGLSTENKMFKDFKTKESLVKSSDSQAVWTHIFNNS